MPGVHDILKQHELRVTPIREMVLAVIRDSKSALSSQDIEMKFSDIDRITLYRTLKTFESKGIIHKAVDGTNIQKFAMCDAGCNEHVHHDQHAHFHCDNCGSTFCLDTLEIPMIQHDTGFQVRSMDVIMKGVCKDCTR